MISLNLDSRYPGRESNWLPFEYKSRPSRTKPVVEGLADVTKHWVSTMKRGEHSVA
jgi:hypothetical protein